MEKNTELAYETLDHIRDHPEEWNQSIYFCGTRACFAGRAVLIWLGLADGRQYRDWQAERHTWLYTQDAAQRALGWTPVEADYVFQYFTTDFAALEQRVKEVLNGEMRLGDYLTMMT